MGDEFTPFINFVIFPKITVYEKIKKDTAYVRQMSMLIAGCLAKANLAPEAERIGLVVTALHFILDISYETLCKMISYEPNIVMLDKSAVEHLEMLYQPPDLPSDMVAYVTWCLIILMMDKTPDTEEFYNKWRENRVKALCQVGDIPYTADLPALTLKMEGAATASKLWLRSRDLRFHYLSLCWMSATSQLMAGRMFEHVGHNLRYGRLTPYYLIGEVMANVKADGILTDPYLLSDAAHYRHARQIVKTYPPMYRDYMGLIAPMMVVQYLGGRFLQRLTYISWVVMKRKEKTLENYKAIIPADAAVLDTLIQKYFPPDNPYPQGSGVELILPEVDRDLASLLRYRGLTGKEKDAFTKFQKDTMDQDIRKGFKRDELAEKMASVTNMLAELQKSYLQSMKRDEPQTTQIFHATDTGSPSKHSKKKTRVRQTTTSESDTSDESADPSRIV